LRTTQNDGSSPGSHFHCCSHTLPVNTSVTQAECSLYGPAALVLNCRRAVCPVATGSAGWPSGISGFDRPSARFHLRFEPLRAAEPEPEPEESPKVADLMEALEASVERMKKGSSGRRKSA